MTAGFLLGEPKPRLVFINVDFELGPRVLHLDNSRFFGIMITMITRMRNIAGQRVTFAGSLGFAFYQEVKST